MLRYKENFIFIAIKYLFSELQSTIIKKPHQENTTISFKVKTLE